MKLKTHTLSFRFFLLTSLTMLACAEGMAQHKNSSRPNIVLVLADDLGYSDLGCYGGEINTPNLDRIAKHGMQFTQFYNVSRCCPTRASLLTGLYNHDAGIGHMTTPQDENGYRGYLGTNTVTIAEVLKQAGYRTAMTGKWHVSNTITQANPQEQLKWLNHQSEHPLFSPITQYPVNRGFDQYYGTIWGVIDFYDPFSLVEGTSPVKSLPKDYYHTDAINDKAAGYIREFSKTEEPFFLYIAHNAPHWPIQAPESDIEKYKDTYKVGWESIRKKRYQKMVSLGLVDSTKLKLSPRNPLEPTWADNPNKEWDARAMAVHAAMIDRMDRGIGRVIKALEETGEMENTIFVFLSDNGASAELSDKYGPGFDRPSQTRDGKAISYATDKSVMPGPQTTFFSIGPSWANVANTPFRLWKSQSLEGGVHTPMIVSWPAGIKAKGSQTNHVAHVMDFMATFIDVSGAKYPKKFKGNTISPLEGKSFAPLFLGKQAEKHAALFNEHEGSKYARVGDWKLVLSGPKKQWQLYNLAVDYSELNDLAAQYPDKVKQMSEMWEAWALKHHVLPKPTK